MRTVDTTTTIDDIYNIHLDKKLFRSLCLCAASFARYYRNKERRYRFIYLIGEPGRLAKTSIMAINYGKTSDVFINNKYYMTVEHRF